RGSRPPHEERMATEVVMPPMGEAIAEGTIDRWLKKVGDNGDRDELLFAVSTGKVNEEIPSRAVGVLTEVCANEGDPVPVNSVVAVIGDAAGAAPTAPGPAEAPPPKAHDATPPSRSPQADGGGAPTPAPVTSSAAAPAAQPPQPKASTTQQASAPAPSTTDE